MDPAPLIPTADTLPVAWPWFKALLIPSFVVHLLFMNALLGTGIIGLIHTLRSRGRHLETARRVAKNLPFYMAFTINFGVAALLFMQVLYGHLFYTSSILMALWWLSALALLLIAYGAAYWTDFKFDGLGNRRSLIWALMVVALLLVAFVFVNNFTLMQDPGVWPRYFQAPGGTFLHWNDATLIPRYLHFVTASVAVGGLILALLHRHGSVERTAGFMQWFTVATGLQFIFGGWFFLTLPSTVRLALTGANPRATVLFTAALLGFLATLAFGHKRRLWPSVGATIFTVLTMVLVRDAVRAIYLAPYFSMEHLTAQTQYSPMLVFGVFFLLGIGAVFYMVRLYLKGAGAP
jgi:hypothetical protein